MAGATRRLIAEIDSAPRETRALARDIGLVPRMAPIESPQSYDMAEAFVKTFKRDYAKVNPRLDAA